MATINIDRRGNATSNGDLMRLKINFEDNRTLIDHLEDQYEENSNKLIAIENDIEKHKEDLENTIGSEKRLILFEKINILTGNEETLEAKNTDIEQKLEELNATKDIDDIKDILKKINFVNEKMVLMNIINTFVQNKVNFEILEYNPKDADSIRFYFGIFFIGVVIGSMFG